MKKYIGIIKIEQFAMSGVHINFLSKTDDNIETLNEWFDLYPQCQHIMLQNNIELDNMFEFCKDMTPITDEEKENSKLLYKKLMKE